MARSPKRWTGSLGGFTTRHAQLVGTVFMLAAAALSAGPDNWMEWVMWGTTVVTVEEVRIILIVLAILLAIGLAWPLIRPARHDS